MEWIPRLSPKYAPPLHLAPLIDILSGYREKPFKVVVHAPPRHGKTDTVLHFISWVLNRDPHKTLAYVTYGADLAESKSLKARQLTRDSGGVDFGEMNRLAEWRTKQGGGLLSMGTDGAFTGKGVDILLIDDPVKNRVEAESPLQRERVRDWHNDVGNTRIEPGGSQIVFMTRWHPNDLAGSLIEKGWPFIRLPAINDLGEALWPERWPIFELEKKKAESGEFTWASLFQGVPRPRGGVVFQDPTYCERLPTHYRAAMGCDLAYSKKTSADHSVSVTMLESEGYFYVSDVRRAQIPAPQFKPVIRGAWESAGRPSIRFYCSGVEQGTADFMKVQDAVNQAGVPINAIVTRMDKFTRAIPLAAAWNAGRVLVPKYMPWIHQYLSEFATFTGVNDDEDDQVDATCPAFDLLNAKAAGFTPVQTEGGSRRI